MEQRDSLGRRRPPEQNRGLRPLHPPLGDGVESRSLRVAMRKEAWELLDEAVRTSGAATAPRAVGALLERAVAPASPVADWQAWQIRKERELLEARRLAS